MSATLPCFKCGKALESALPPDYDENQPHEGTSFTADGHYGSTVFDPMNGTYLEINVCDECLLGNVAAVLHGTPAVTPLADVKPWIPAEADPAVALKEWEP